MLWNYTKHKYPIATESGCWDGLRSSKLLVKTFSGKYYVATMYKVTMDGHEFCDFYDENDFDIANVEAWIEIED